MKSALSYAVLVGAGVAGAIVGAVAHRSYPFWGAAACVAMVLLAAVFARTWRSWAGLGAFAAAWGAMTVVLSMEGSSGSVLIVEDPLGLTWLLGGAAAIVIAALVPYRLLGRADVAA